MEQFKTDPRQKAALKLEQGISLEVLQVVKNLN